MSRILGRAVEEHDGVFSRLRRAVAREEEFGEVAHHVLPPGSQGQRPLELRDRALSPPRILRQSAGETVVVFGTLGSQADALLEEDIAPKKSRDSMSWRART